MSIMRHEDLPRTEFALPGPLRDDLVSAVLAGHKVSTTSLRREYELEGTPLPKRGQRSVVVNRPVAVIETTSVKVVRLGDVDVSHANDEGEGYTSVAEWRAGHEGFWHSDEIRREVVIRPLPSMTAPLWCWSAFVSLSDSTTTPTDPAS